LYIRRNSRKMEYGNYLLKLGSEYFFLSPSYPSVTLKMYTFYGIFTFTLREEHAEGIRRQGAVEDIGTQDRGSNRG
jgi:hypothetical protein